MEDIQVIEPYKQEGNNYFIRFRDKELVLEKIADNHYKRHGDFSVLDGKELLIFTDETISPANIIIE